jgi:autotransporter strand-loop-strand O-heptosyltransferase
VIIGDLIPPSNGFNTPYRVISHLARKQCWNDPGFLLDHKDFLRCPKYPDTPRRFDSARPITPEQVNGFIKIIPGSAYHPASAS